MDKEDAKQVHFSKAIVYLFNLLNFHLELNVRHFKVIAII